MSDATNRLAPDPPADNPYDEFVRETLNKVQTMIDTAIAPLTAQIADLEARVKSLEPQYRSDTELS